MTARMDQPLALDAETMHDPLIFGRVLDGDGGGRAIDWDAAQHWRPQGREVLWLHLDRTAPGVQHWLQERCGMSEPTAELLVSDATRPRAFREGEALVATMRGINFNPGAEPEDMVSMQVWSDGKQVITLRRIALQTPKTTREEIDRGTGPADAGALITRLTEHLIERMSSVVLDLNTLIDDLEECDSRGDDGLLDAINRIRRECLGLKRFMSPQHEALENIARDAPEWFEEHDRREMEESIARLRRYLDDLDISKESALVLQDDVRARAIAATSRTQTVLAVVATIFLPLNFLAGLLGMNVGGVPGGEVAGPSHAFWIVLGIGLLVLGGQLALFKRLGWF